MENNPAPEPEKKKGLKVYTFTRNLNPEEKNEETPGKDILNQENNILNFSLNLYDKEISIIATKKNINPKLPDIIYETYISLETLQGFNKFFSILETEKIYTIIQNSFEQKFDHITIEEDKILIKLMINVMEVITEEIKFELTMVKLSDEEETKIIKESIKLLTEEKNSLKQEVISLNNTIDEFKKLSAENNNDFKTKLEEKEKKLEENKKELNLKLEENKKEFEMKLEENKKEFEKRLEEKEKEYQKIFEKFQQEMKEVKEIEKYVKERIIIEQKEEKEIKSYLLQRKMIINDDTFNYDISIFLFDEKIKFKIIEIQDNLKNNPIIYESDFVMKDFGKLSDYYKNEGGIKSIFEFLIPIFKDEGKDTLIKELNKIIIKVKYTFGNKEDEINFEIVKKELGLKNVLINIDKTLKEINKDNIKQNEHLANINKDIDDTKEQFKKDLLEKVYPIGSYYWSEKDTSPENIFGGRWKKIEGRFLFASNSNHYVGQTGGEESHRLTIDEMPNHSHGYTKFTFQYAKNRDSAGASYAKCPCIDHDADQDSFYTYSTTSNCGGNNYHNNMPPYLTANCWKRIF